MMKCFLFGWDNIGEGNVVGALVMDDGGLVNEFSQRDCLGFFLGTEGERSGTTEVGPMLD